MKFAGRIFLVGIVAWLLSAATSHLCGTVYQMGEAHGRFMQETERAPVDKSMENDLRECRGDLNDQELIGASCDKALLDCEDGARYVALTCARGFCYK